MSEHPHEEHELPTVEAVLAGTLALMTGYSQALLAEVHPEHRVLMGRKIGNNLALLAEHPQLSASFQAIVGGLKRRWAQMAGCTAEAAPVCQTARCLADAAEPSPNQPARAPTHATLHPMVCEAPWRLQ